MTQILLGILFPVCAVLAGALFSAIKTIQHQKLILDSYEQLNDADGHYSRDFFKLCRVVMSCENTEQLDIAKRYYAQFAMRYEPCEFIEYNIVRKEDAFSAGK